MRYLPLLILLGLSCLFTVNAQASAMTSLSNETTQTRWAYPAKIARVMKHAGGKHMLTKTRYRTEDGLPELYVALSAKRVNGTEWVKIRLPRRPNNSTGWVPRSSLGPWHVVHTQLVIDRFALKATLYRYNKVVFRARVGVGKRSTPTPGGNFYIREKLRGFHSPVYGPRVMATSAYAPGLSDWPRGGIIGIHGTNEPNLVPGRPSHGCIRMRNNDALRLYNKINLGTPVLIL